MIRLICFAYAYPCVSRFGALVLYKSPVQYPVVLRLVFVRNLATLDFALGVLPLSL